MNNNATAQSWQVAQPSSIVLTTLTDLLGSMPFLGIATALSGMLPQG